jgi:hypothetical protein
MHLEGRLRRLVIYKLRRGIETTYEGVQCDRIPHEVRSGLFPQAAGSKARPTRCYESGVRDKTMTSSAVSNVRY